MLDLLQSLRWQDLADILIVAFIIYRAIMMIRGTRAVQMLAGIAVLTVVYFGAKELELMTLYWLLGTLLSSIFLIIVIVFQRDIRKALVQVGQASPFTRPTEDRESDLNEVVVAARQLAQRKIGALIILERETGLKDYLDSGQIIDARLSSGLLLSLFHPGSPLHDGGVVVGSGRIHSARCVLPLTKSPYVSKHLGTRHRAAIGLSEETDAVIVVVSEETRQISLVQHGGITTNLDEADLRDRLRSILVPKERPTTVLKNWLNRQ